MSSRPRNAYAAPAWAAEQKVGDVGTKATLLVLANYADEEFSGYPSQATIARETEQGERTVRRQLALLEELGLIRRVKRGGSGGGRSSDRFYLQLDVVITDPSPIRERMTQKGDEDRSYRPDRPVGVTGQGGPETGGGYRPNQGGLPATGGRGTPRTPSNNPPTPLPGLDAAGAAERDGDGGESELSPEQQWERWWFTYPRKTGKAAALKAWRAATRKVPPQQLLAALEAHLPAWSAREERFIPHASTWLNNERWEDAPEPPPRREYSPWDAPTPEQIAASHGL